MVFPFVAAKFEAERRFPRLASQLPATVFPFVAAGFGPHSDGLSEGRLSRGCCPISYIDADTEWPHDVHADEAGR